MKLYNEEESVGILENVASFYFNIVVFFYHLLIWTESNIPGAFITTFVSFGAFILLYLFLHLYLQNEYI